MFMTICEISAAYDSHQRLRAAAVAARDELDFAPLGLMCEQILALITENEILRQQLRPKPEPELSEPTPPAPPTHPTSSGRRIPTVMDTSPEAEQRRAQIRSLIRERGLSMTTRPDGLIHIKGYDVDLLVRDLINAHESDFRRYADVCK